MKAFDQNIYNENLQNTNTDDIAYDKPLDA